MSFNHFTQSQIIPELRRPPRTGWARFKYPNGDEYLGQFFQGLRHGRGAYLSSSGMKFAGQWWADQRHGEGTLIQERVGFFYTGQWVADKKHGIGQQLSTKECYWGSFAENKFSGKVS